MLSAYLVAAAAAVTSPGVRGVLTHQVGCRALGPGTWSRSSTTGYCGPDLQVSPGAWLRVRQLTFAAQLARSQTNLIRALGRSILARPRIRGEEEDRARLARPMLASTWFLRSAAELDEAAPVDPSRAGPRPVAAERPGRGQRELLPGQLESLWEVGRLSPADIPRRCCRPWTGCQSTVSNYASSRHMAGPRRGRHDRTSLVPRPHHSHPRRQAANRAQAAIVRDRTVRKACRKHGIPEDLSHDHEHTHGANLAGPSLQAIS